MNKQEILEALEAGKTLSNGMFAVSIKDNESIKFNTLFDVIFKQPEDWEIYNG